MYSRHEAETPTCRPVRLLPLHLVLKVTQEHIDRAFSKSVGEMRDELRRFDHLTRNQRAQVVEDESGDLALEHEGLDWMNPQEPVSIDATVATGEDEDSCPLIDLIEE